MITEQQLKTEITNTLALMQAADQGERGYLVGKLATLLWVQGGGDVLRTDARYHAERAWLRMHPIASTT